MTKQPEQEPVAYRCRVNGHWSYKPHGVSGLVCEPLYTTPPQRKPWVFLSISDMADCGASVDDPSRWELLGDGWGNMIVQYTRLVETKLRELNEAPQRKPLTQAEVVEGFCKQPHDVQFVSVFDAGVRFAEAAHGIKE